ncbi:jg5100 [Pararge aegeria aegeria]|uniref:Jg5100 protein n=1 Tax=Pararge aegeria aegeria TaxID=348720 RepID=A0A8S4S186_9NEOP|nr:jg5100 [Pararge aegeria aegeria]
MLDDDNIKNTWPNLVYPARSCETSGALVAPRLRGTDNAILKHIESQPHVDEGEQLLHNSYELKRRMSSSRVKTIQSLRAGSRRDCAGVRRGERGAVYGGAAAAGVGVGRGGRRAAARGAGGTRPRRLSVSAAEQLCKS